MLDIGSRVVFVHSVTAFKLTLLLISTTSSQFVIANAEDHSLKC